MERRTTLKEFRERLQDMIDGREVGNVKEAVRILNEINVTVKGLKEEPEENANRVNKSIYNRLARMKGIVPIDALKLMQRYPQQGHESIPQYLTRLQNLP
jgi:cytochrome c-type biogenesis protein CcmH/NrfG